MLLEETKKGFVEVLEDIQRRLRECVEGGSRKNQKTFLQVTEAFFMPNFAGRMGLWE